MNSPRTLGAILIGAAVLAAGFAGVIIFRELHAGEASFVLALLLVPLGVQAFFGWSLLQK